jgi:AP endonuclease-2
VFAVFKDKVPMDEGEVDIHDIVNPPGMFVKGERQREYSTKDLLPLSGRLIPEFDRRRSIKDMFFGKPATSSTGNRSIRASDTQASAATGTTVDDATVTDKNVAKSLPAITEGTPSALPNSNSKRPRTEVTVAPPPKRSKSASKPETGKGQQSLMGFFRPKKTEESNSDTPDSSTLQANSNSSPTKPAPEEETIIDPIVSKESWSKLFTKKAAPKCEDHKEPCMMMTTKKAGVNCGRSFWMCSRPLGPTGQKERGTQWRCGTFIWASDWTG